MKYGITLIDKAAEKCGSYYKLSKLTGMHESTISAIRSGKRKLPVARVPRMAELAGQDAADWVWKVLQENQTKTSTRKEIVDILGKGIAAGVAAMCLFSYSSESISKQIPTHEPVTVVNKLYIVEYVMRLLTLISQRLSLVIRWFALKPTR